MLHQLHGWSANGTNHADRTGGGVLFAGANDAHPQRGENTRGGMKDHVA